MNGLRLLSLLTFLSNTGLSYGQAVAGKIETDTLIGIAESRFMIGLQRLARKQ